MKTAMDGGSDGIGGGQGRGRARSALHPLARAQDDAARPATGTGPQAVSPSYRLAFADEDFLLASELRPVRMQLELMKAEMALDAHGITSTLTIFGSARTASPERNEAERAAGRAPSARDLRGEERYQQARRLGRLAAEEGGRLGLDGLAVLTGGGPGIMEAANRGASEGGGKSVGLAIVLPKEEAPNPWVTPELCFRFHYFAARKMHFLMRSAAIVAFPGGFGTLDEVFEAATLMQTGKMGRIPFVLVGRDYWSRVLDFDAMVEEGVVSPEDPGLFDVVDDADAAWDAVRRFWGWKGAGE